MAKPVVDRLERDLEGRAKVLRIDAFSQVGQTLVRQYGIRAVPTFLVFDGNGEAVYVQAGLPDREAIATLVAQLHSDAQ
ncbi:MAG: thioredoxin family protein [Anaerolineae bacterium]|nr:thioredoxin family protein [Anaerolineae bacterium]MCX8066409.1 thioredoxin family protein [Anaerolineae bacterium]MDW7991365.1 thioredoxin family protein [Anaerolineae bacterium]